MIKGQDNNIKIKFLFFLRLYKINNTRVIKFNCAPKLSEFNKAEKINKISVFERSVNSIFFNRLISDKPFK